MANSNRVIVPAARAALDQFKMEAANEVGVNLKQGYNGDLTSKQAGSIGGQMVKKMIEAYENGMKYLLCSQRSRRKSGGFYLRFFVCSYFPSLASNSSASWMDSRIIPSQCAFLFILTTS